MDTESGQDRRPGGTIEPANRAAVAKQRFQTPEEAPGTRYELRDPFAEVTYRTKTFDEMVIQADRLGAIRFNAVDPDGKRTPVAKVDGAWQRPETREAEAPAPTTDAKQRADNIVPLAASVAPPTAIVARIEADAARAAYVERLEAMLRERYVIKRSGVKVGEVTIGQTEYRYRGDVLRVAFTESTFKLATDNNNPSVARSMVDVAEARRWQALRISGNEDFRRLVWLEASVRGVKTLGYEPQHADLELLRREREARQVNRIEPAPHEGESSAGAAKQSARGSSGRKAVLVALEAVLVAKHVPAKQREAIMASATENLAQRLRDGQTHKVKVFDKTAPVQRPAMVPTPEVQRRRERTAPVR